MSYYSIDDILAETTKFPCRFNYDIPGLGFLEGNPGKAINKNAKIELPFWLAKILAIVGVEHDLTDEAPLPFLELLPPDLFGPKVINAIKSDATSLDVHSINVHFYSLAIKWASLFNDREIANITSGMLLERCQEINNYAVSGSSDDQQMAYYPESVSSFLLTLDEFEKLLYTRTKRSSMEMKNWIFKK